MLAQSSDPDPEGDERNPRCFWIGPEYICPPNPTRPPTDPPPPPTPCNADPVTFECLPPPTTPPTATKPPPPTPTDPPTPTPVIIVIPPLDAPALSGRVSGTSLTLTWTEVTQADQYEVQERRIQCRSERGQQRCGEIWWLTVRSTPGLTEAFSGLTVGRAYTYRVCSYRGIDRLTVCSGGQTWTIDPTATPIPEPTPTETPVPTATPLPLPPAPSLTVTVPPPNNGVHSISASWPAITGVTIYKLAYGPTDGSENTTSDIYPPSTSASVGPGCGVTTYFKARAYGDGVKYARAWGRWSASEDGTTGACQPTPEPTATPAPGINPAPLSAVIYGYGATDDGRLVEQPVESRSVHQQWFVLERETIVVRLRGSNLEDYTYNLFTNPDAGIHVLGRDADGYPLVGCLPKSMHPAWSGWMEAAIVVGDQVQTAQVTIDAIRCDVGNGANTGMVLRALPKDGGAEVTVETTGSIPQGWHRPSSGASYTVAAQSTHIGLVRQGTLYAVEDWNTAVGTDYFTRATNASSASVTIKSYRRSQGDECKSLVGFFSGNIIACADSGGPFPHLDDEAIIWIAFPPDDVVYWTNSLWEARNDSGGALYLPEVMTHELGHTVGLGHLPPGSMTIMQESYDEDKRLEAPTNQDVYGFALVDEPHAH